MSYKIELSQKFERQAKALLKKYPSLQKELIQLRNDLIENPQLGTSIGHHCFKIRLSIASKGKGKSGGARVISFVFISGKTIYLLSIYDKSEQENLSDKELKELIKSIGK